MLYIEWYDTVYLLIIALKTWSYYINKVLKKKRQLRELWSPLVRILFHSIRFEARFGINTILHPLLSVAQNAWLDIRRSWFDILVSFVSNSCWISDIYSSLWIKALCVKIYVFSYIANLHCHPCDCFPCVYCICNMFMFISIM